MYKNYKYTYIDMCIYIIFNSQKFGGKQNNKINKKLLFYMLGHVSTLNTNNNILSHPIWLYNYLH